MEFQLFIVVVQVEMEHKTRLEQVYCNGMVEEGLEVQIQILIPVILLQLGVRVVVEMAMLQRILLVQLEVQILAEEVVAQTGKPLVGVLAAAASS